MSCSNLNNDVLQGKNTDFIQANLVQLQKKCKEFHACTEELYRSENYHRILSGGKIQLKNICGLLYANGGGEYTTLDTECTSSERQAIGHALGEKLVNRLVQVPRDDDLQAWSSLGQCVANSTLPSESNIDTVCRLQNGTTPLCGDNNVHKTTRDFFNNQLEQLHCSCEAIDSFSQTGTDTGRRPPTIRNVRFAIAGGVIVILIVLVVLVIVLCLRHRKTKRKLKQHRMRYSPPGAGEEERVSSIYQEIHSTPRAPKLPSRQITQGKLLPQGYDLDLAPPVTERYVRGPPRPGLPNARTPSDDDDRPHSYLEPLPDPVPISVPAGTVNVQYSLARQVVDPAAKGNNSYGLALPVVDSTVKGSNSYNLTLQAGDPAVKGNNPYSLARQVEDPSPVVVKMSEGSYYESLAQARELAPGQDDGYSMLRVPGQTVTQRASDPQYFELEPDGSDRYCRLEGQDSTKL